MSDLFVVSMDFENINDSFYDGYENITANRIFKSIEDAMEEIENFKIKQFIKQYWSDVAVLDEDLDLMHGPTNCKYTIIRINPTFSNCPLISAILELTVDTYLTNKDDRHFFKINKSITHYSYSYSNNNDDVDIRTVETRHSLLEIYPNIGYVLERDRI